MGKYILKLPLLETAIVKVINSFCILGQERESVYKDHSLCSGLFWKDHLEGPHSQAAVK